MVNRREKNSQDTSDYSCRSHLSGLILGNFTQYISMRIRYNHRKKKQWQKNVSINDQAKRENVAEQNIKWEFGSRLALIQRRSVNHGHHPKQTTDL